MGISDGELLARLGLAVLLCGAIGLEREARDQPAGLRTHILVGVGAALFTLVSAYGFSDAPGSSPDPTRISAQIVSGIGFLGAGAIIRQGLTVRGLTTAAALWIVAAIGMAAGAGYYFGAVVTTVLVLIALVGFRRLRPTLISRLRSDFVLLELDLGGDAQINDVFAILARHGASVEGMESARDGDDQAVRLELLVPPRVEFEAAMEEIRALSGLNRAEARGYRAPRGQFSSED
jgi:putative Mg2+ transporter-C (MgtC) family protein